MGRWLLREPEGCQAEESQHGLIFCVELDDLIEYVSPEKQCHDDNSSDSSTGVKNRICLSAKLFWISSSNCCANPILWSLVKRDLLLARADLEFESSGLYKTEGSPITG